MRATLFIVGAFVELAGILLVASPDLVPQGQRASRWLRRRYLRFRQLLGRVRRGIVGRVRRLTRRHGPQVVTIGTARETDIAMPITAVTGRSVGTSLEERVAFLLYRDEKLGERLEALRSAMEKHVADALGAAHREYLPLRLIGVAGVVVGLGCVTLANFV